MTISEQITAGIKEAFKGTISADLEAMTKDRDAEKTRADKAAADLAAMTKERDDLKAQLAAKNTELETAKAEVVKLTGAKGEADSKAVTAAAAKQAATIAASAGQPAVPDKGQTANATDDKSLVEKFNSISDSKERAEFYAKHFAPKFARKA